MNLLYRFHLLDHVGIGWLSLAKLHDFFSCEILPSWIGSEKHQAPSGGDRYRLMPGIVDVLAVIDNEAIGRARGVRCCLTGGAYTL